MTVFASTTTIRICTLIVLVLAAASLALLRDPPKSAFAVALAFATVWLFPVDGTDIQTLRSFFGVHKIYESDDGRFRILKNGSTIHGAEMIETEDGEAVRGRPRPITYYHDKSAMNRVIEAVRARKGGPLRTASSDLVPGHSRVELRRAKPGASSRLTQRSLTSRATRSVSPFCRPARRACRSCLATRV